MSDFYMTTVRVPNRLAQHAREVGQCLDDRGTWTPGVRQILREHRAAAEHLTDEGRTSLDNGITSSEEIKETTIRLPHDLADYCRSVGEDAPQQRRGPQGEFMPGLRRVLRDHIALCRMAEEVEVDVTVPGQPAWK